MAHTQIEQLTENEKLEVLLDAKNINSRLNAIEDSIKRIELALVGNPSLGHKGIVERINALEVAVESHERKFLTWGTALTVVLFILQFASSYIKSWLRGE